MYVEYLGLAGFDWVFIEAEHTGMSVETCYSLVTAADAVGMASVVRVRAQDVGSVIPYAETGPSALLVPHLVSSAQAEALVSSLRFPPQGTRGIAGNTRAANFGFGHTAAEYFADQEGRIIIGGMIEDDSAIDDLGSILAVDGIELLCIGLADLAGSLKLPGQINHPKVQERQRQAIDALSASGRPFICGVHSASSARDVIALGAPMVDASGPTMVRDTLTSFIRDVTAKRPA